MRKIQCLKYKFVGNDMVLSLNDFVEKEKVDCDVIGSAGMRYTFAKERTRDVLHCIVKTNSYNLIQLAKAVFGIAPAEVLSKTSRAPILRLGHLQRSRVAELYA